MYQNNRNTRESFSHEQSLTLSQSDAQKIIEGNNQKMFIEMAEIAGKYLSKGTTTSTLRKIYSAILSIKSAEEAIMIKPKLAYLKGRGLIKSDFYQYMNELLSQIQTNENLKNFKKFSEAIVAYHKFNEAEKK